MLSLRLPDDIDQRLSHLAKVTNRPKSYYVCEAIERSLGDIEDAYLAESAYESFLKKGEKEVSLDELKESLGLDD
jgi:RHH-type transcriptional regulator, rel operon repressor / antitoxin RelB